MVNLIHLLSVCCFGVLLAGLAPIAKAQNWERMHEMGSGRYTTMVEFPEESGVAGLGFVATNGFDDVTFETYSELLKTTDGGLTWRKLSRRWMGNVHIKSLAFADALTGWIGLTSTTDDGGIYKTIDGGETWFPSGLRFQWISALHFNPLTERLHSSGWSQGGALSSYYSDDRGESWERFGKYDLNGYAFADPLRGIVSSLLGEYWRTTDGGMSWEELEMDVEAWQPCYHTSNESFYVVSEIDHNVYRSTDHGSSWNSVFDFKSIGVQTTGTILSDGCNLYTQGFNNLENIYVSSNSGVTWDSIGGPSGNIDTRFDIANGYIYAAGPNNTYTLEPSAIFRELFLPRALRVHKCNSRARSR